MSDFTSTLTLEKLRGLDPPELTLITTAGERFPLRLIEITDLGRRPAGFRAPADVAVREECFSLVFEGPAAPTFAQGSWVLEHPQLGAGPVFLVPIGQGAPGPMLAVPAPAEPSPQRYEAVFY